MSTLGPEESFEKDFLGAQRKLTKERKRLLRQQIHRKSTLDQAQDWPSVHHQGLLLQANLFKIQPKMTSIDVVDWEQPEGAPLQTILLDPLLPAPKQVEVFFKKSKKLRTAVSHAKRLLEEVEKALVENEAAAAELELCNTPGALKVFCQKHRLFDAQKEMGKKKDELKPSKLPYKAFVSASGSVIWAGKSAKDNDLLTFHHAKGSDWWLHAHNCTGSHVVVRVAKGEEPDEITLRDAAEIALRMSQGKNMRSGEVTVTQVKWLRRVKSSPGKVMLSEYRAMSHDLDDVRWNRLRN